MKSSNKNTLHIILVSGDKDYQFLFERALKALNFDARLTSMTDGEHLTDFLIKNPASIPDILFLDLNIPNKNGYECLSEIMQNDQFHNLPIIVLSDSFPSEKNDKILMLKMLLTNKASDFIRKPIDYSLLKQDIERCLTKAIEAKSVNYTTNL